MSQHVVQPTKLMNKMVNSRNWIAKMGPLSCTQATPFQQACSEGDSTPCLSAKTNKKQTHI